MRHGLQDRVNVVDEQKYIIDALEEDGIEYEVKEGRIYTKSKEEVTILPSVITNAELEEENRQLWDIVNFLLKADGYIPSESEL